MGRTTSEPARGEPVVHGEIGTAAAIDRIVDLTRAAEPAKIVHITTEGLGAHLPASVPALMKLGERPEVTSLRTVIEDYRREPERRTGSAHVTTLRAFTDLVSRHKDEHSAIFAKTTWPNPSLTAVLDYHEREGGRPRHGKHRVHYAFPITEEWKAWIDHNGKPMSQVDFAAFLEEHTAELSAPLDQEKSDYERDFKERCALPNELIDLSRHLEVFQKASVKQGVRLASGERVIEFTDEHLNARGEKIEIPGFFMVSVRAFIDGEPVRIPARLRYRLAGGAVLWFYQLYRWDHFLRERVAEDLRIAGEETELPTFEGAPEA